MEVGCFVAEDTGAFQLSGGTDSSVLEKAWLMPGWTDLETGYWKTVLCCAFE